VGLFVENVLYKRITMEVIHVQKPGQNDQAHDPKTPHKIQCMQKAPFFLKKRVEKDQ